ncbi:TonB-dependent receptor [Reichenbachiella sp. MALMAid0571]|uniref:SusC/RagA family TonB-linked outer membrane protein n=1 Tax=Reichenbachiella sp. MALMAid0571 TaxID=3143939 RepID=UPI0032DEE9FC
MKSNLLQQLFTLMKYSLLIIIIQTISLNLLLADIVNAQKAQSIREVSISLESSQTKLFAILREIESKTDYKFAYNGKDLKKLNYINTSKDKTSVYEILYEIARQTGLDFKQVNQTINVSQSKKKNGGEVKIKTAIEPIKLTGVITDEMGEPMIGVTVRVQGSNTGMITDVNGKYSIEADTDAILLFSFVGYITEQIPVGNRTVIDVQMRLDAQQLEELVVVGYGSKRKADITSAVSVVDMKDMGNQPASNAARFLRGKAAGVVVTQGSGTPGQEMSVMIRGVSSLGTDQRPLYVVDGFPVGNEMGKNLNPNDIESISVLKDAASTAIYGARGSNGVVLITTKRAKEGEVSITASANYGFQNIPDSRRVKMMSGPEYAQWRKEQFIEKSILAGNGVPSIDDIPENYRYPEQTKYSTDWFDEIMNHNAAFENYNVTLSSGKGDVKSLVSVSYLNQEGAVIKTNFERFNIRANIDGKINNFISMGLNIVGSHSNERFANTTNRDAIIGKALWADPREPVFNEDGSWNDYIGGNGGTFGSANPVMELHQTKNTQGRSNLTSNGYMQITFLKDFKFRTSVNTSITNFKRNEFRPSTLAGTGFDQAPPRNATLAESYTNWINVSADQLLSYSKSIENHQFDVMLGYTSQEQTDRSLSGTGNTFPDDEIRFLDNAENTTTSSSESSWSLLAYFARLNYSYKGKYLMSASYRREGSSRFGKNNLWGTFPAVSVGWRLSEEAFMSDLSFLSDLKLRASFGVTGNNNIGEYNNSSNLSTEGYIIGGQYASGQKLSGFVNTNLGWEQSDQLDIGLDLMAFDNKLSFTAELYKKITNDMLLSAPLPIITGFSSTLTNLGKVENKGLELAIGYRTNVGQDLRLRGDFNIAFNKNKVLEINGDNDELWTGGFYGTYNRSTVGRPIGVFVGYQMLGIFNTQAEIDASPVQDGAIPGVYKYADINNDGIISYSNTGGDMVEIGNPHPDFTWGLTLGADYKGFDLNVLFTGAQDYDISRQIEKTTLNMDGVFNILAEAKNRWKSAEDPGNGWIPTSSHWKWERETNSRYIYDASHMWVKSITLGYTLPSTTPVLAGTRFYFNIDNLLIVTNYPGNNVDIDRSDGRSFGDDDEAYPVPRIVTLGASIRF